MSAGKKFLRAAGAILSLVCVGWIFLRFCSSGLLHSIEESDHAGLLFERIGMAATIYAVAVVGLGVAWWTLQCVFAERVSATATVMAYSTTQIGKYLPGNVAQYVGRHVTLRRLGLTHSSLVLCAIVEAVLLVFAALQWGFPLLLRNEPPWMVGALLIFVPTGVVILITIAKITHWKGWFGKHFPIFNVRFLVYTFAIYLIFFGLMGLTLAVIESALAGLHLSFFTTVGVASVSWISGYVVVGAPAGIGVREVVFVSLLSGTASEGDILVLVAGFRAATLCGDVLAFFAALLFRTVCKPLSKNQMAQTD